MWRDAAPPTSAALARVLALSWQYSDPYHSAFKKKKVKASAAIL
jgi:hypothetical protein